MNILVCGMGGKICIELVSKRPGGIFFFFKLLATTGNIWSIRKIITEAITKNNFHDSAESKKNNKEISPPVLTIPWPDNETS